MTVRRLARPLLLAGIVAVVLGLGKAHAVRHGYDLTASSRFTWSLAYAALLAVCAYGAGLPDLSSNRRSALVATLASTAAAALGISLLQLLTGSAQLPRFVIFMAPAVLLPVSLLCASLAADGRAQDEERDRLLAVASAGEAITLADELAARPERHATLVRTLEPAAARAVDPRHRPLLEAASATRATAVVLDREAQADESIVAQAAALHERGVRVRTLSLCYDEWLGKLPVSELERVSLMFDIGELHRARYGRMKRVADVGLGLVGLAMLAAVTPVVLIGNRFGNRGPLLFRQPRVGKNGRVFEILKFRTMVPGAGASEWTAPGDPRVTRFGAWLRRTHLDELPQALNIVRGDLSVVGPRPEQPGYVEELAEKIPFYNLRHLVRPGLSGWAQVKYPYGSTEADALEKLQYEFYYLRHQGLGLDLRIIGRTVRSVIGRGGR
ncbi:MAG TPA: sugar transferase [Acidimicrobiales bacterium]|nr:sugar transferase [Acidimicrobiales bacterium]